MKNITWPIIGGAITAVVVARALMWWWKPPRTKTATVTGLWYYPIKSCKGYELKVAHLDNLGFKNDRQYMVIDKNNVFVSQRKKPKMCLIRPTISEDGNTITLEAPDMKPITVIHPVKTQESPNTETELVHIWHDEVDAIVIPGAEEWLTKYIGMPCRLVGINRGGSHKRVIDPEFSTVTEEDNIQNAFQDGYPILLISEESLMELNEKLDEPVDMRLIGGRYRRFRPNIQVNGCLPQEEDSWKKIRIRDVEYDMVKRCDRCVMPAVNPDTGVFTKRYQPTLALKSYRSNGVDTFFGMNLIHRKTVGTIAIGDTVEVLEWH